MSRESSRPQRRPDPPSTDPRPGERNTKGDCGFPGEPGAGRSEQKRWQRWWRFSGPTLSAHGHARSRAQGLPLRASRGLHICHAEHGAVSQQVTATAFRGGRHPSHPKVGRGLRPPKGAPLPLQRTRPSLKDPGPGLPNPARQMSVKALGKPVITTPHKRQTDLGLRLVTAFGNAGSAERRGRSGVRHVANPSSVTGPPVVTRGHLSMLAQPARQQYALTPPGPLFQRPAHWALSWPLAGISCRVLGVHPSAPSPEARMRSQ